MRFKSVLIHHQGRFSVDSQRRLSELPPDVLNVFRPAFINERDAFAVKLGSLRGFPLAMNWQRWSSSTAIAELVADHRIASTALLVRDRRNLSSVLSEFEQDVYDTSDGRCSLSLCEHLAELSTPLLVAVIWRFGGTAALPLGDLAEALNCLAAASFEAGAREMDIDWQDRKTANRSLSLFTRESLFAGESKSRNS